MGISCRLPLELDASPGKMFTLTNLSIPSPFIKTTSVDICGDIDDQPLLGVAFFPCFLESPIEYQRL